MKFFKIFKLKKPSFNLTSRKGDSKRQSPPLVAPLPTKAITKSLLKLSDRKYSEEELFYGVEKLDIALPPYWESSSSTSSCSSRQRPDAQKPESDNAECQCNCTSEPTSRSGSLTLDQLVFRTRPTSVLTDDSPLEYSSDEEDDTDSLTDVDSLSGDSNAEDDDEDLTAVNPQERQHRHRQRALKRLERGPSSRSYRPTPTQPPFGQHPIEFSENPENRSREMFELAEDMIEHALRKVEEFKGLLDDYQVEQIEYSLERLNDFRDRLDMFEHDSPIARLLRIELFIADAGDFLKRVLLMVHTAQDAEYDDTEED